MHKSYFDETVFSSTEAARAPSSCLNCKLIWQCNRWAQVAAHTLGVDVPQQNRRKSRTLSESWREHRRSHLQSLTNLRHHRSQRRVTIKVVATPSSAKADLQGKGCRNRALAGKHLRMA